MLTTAGRPVKVCRFDKVRGFDMTDKTCKYCSQPIINRGAENFCCHKCRAAYMRLQADKTRFHPIENYEEYLKNFYKPMRIVISRCWNLACGYYDVDDFKQICCISLWKLICNHPDKLQNISYVMKTFEIAIKEYCREQGINNNHYLSEDPIFFANPEGIAEQREMIKKIKINNFKHLLMYSLGDLSIRKLAERIGVTKSCLEYRIWNERNILKNLLEYEY